MRLLDLDLVLAAFLVPFNWFVAGAIWLIWHRLPVHQRSDALRIRGQAQGFLALACTSVVLLALKNEGLLALDDTQVGLIRIALVLMLSAPAVGFTWYAWRGR